MTEPTVHPSAPPNDLPADRLRLRPDSAGAVSVDPASAGWRYLSFRTITLAGSDSIEIGGPGHETAVVNLVGGDAVVVDGDGGEAVLTGRTSVFDALPSAYYLPARTSRRGQGRDGRTGDVHVAGHRGGARPTRGLGRTPLRAHPAGGHQGGDPRGRPLDA